MPTYKKKRRRTRLALVLLGAPILALMAASAWAETNAPAPPVDCAVTEVTETSVSFAWCPAPTATAETQYVICEYAIAIGATNATCFTVTGLRPGTKYVFRIKTRNGQELSAPGKPLTIATNGTPPAPGAPPAKKVVAYYASWRAYAAYTPDNLDGSKLTAINYAFADIGKELKLIVSDPAVDYGNFDALARLKQRCPHLLTFVSVGGWDGSARFSKVAATESARADFAASCVDYIRKYGFDGVDLDWEYPVTGGKTGNGKSPNDKKNFTLLLAELRAQLDERSAADGKPYYLTIAGAATPSYIRTYTEMSLVQQYVDWINVMTYDLHGGWDKVTDFGAPLYNNDDLTGQDKISVAGAIQCYADAGVPLEKIVMGVPFYGYVYRGVTNANGGLYQRFKSCGTVSALEAAVLGRSLPGFTGFWHDQSMAPWLFDGSTFISFDDAQSLAQKAGFVRDKALGGVMIWEISLDPNQELLDVLVRGLVGDD